MTAFRITQGAGVGEYGIARQDITVFSTGGSVTLEAEDQTGESSDYVWEVLSEPDGSSVSIVTPVPAAPWLVTVDLLLTGGYLFRLTFKPGTVDEDIRILYVGIPLANSGLCIPANNETVFDNSYAAGGSGDTYVGYERKLTALYRWIDANAGGAGGTPGGSDTEIQFNDGGSFAGAEAYYDSSSGNIGLRNPQPYFDIDIANNPSMGLLFGGTNVAVRTYGVANQAPHLLLMKANGVAATPAALASGDAIGSVEWVGAYDSGVFDAHNCARIAAVAAENFVLGAAGVNLAVYTNIVGEVIPTLHTTFHNAGDLNLNTGGILIKEYQGTAAAGALEWDGTNFRGYDGSSWVNLDGAAGGSLDDAYDLGRTITADAGAVVINNAANDTTNALELTRSTGTGNTLNIQNDIGGDPTDTNQKSIFLTAASPAAQTIWSDQELHIGTSESTLGMHLHNRATGGALLKVMAEAVTTGNSALWVTSSGATASDTTGYLLLQAAGAGTGAESKVEVKATAGSTGPGVVDIYASGGAAYVQVGGDACDVRLNDDNRAGSTWTTQAFITLSDASAEWDLLESNCGGEVSLINAINQAYAAGGGDDVTLAASATIGGMSLTGQEIGNQAAAATETTAAVTALGTIPGSTYRNRQITWGDDGNWWFSGDADNQVFRHDGGTTWTTFTNASETSSADYQYHGWYDGKLWTGVSSNPANPNRVWSLDPDTGTWTGHGGEAENIIPYGFCEWDSTILVSSASGTMYKWVSGTTWTSLGDIGGSHRAMSPTVSGGKLYVITNLNGCFEYTGSGTTWTDLSPPANAKCIADWNGIPVVGFLDSGIPKVYKYESSTWTQLGSALSASSHTFFEFLAADSNGNLYARPSGPVTEQFYKYDSGTDSWSSVFSEAKVNETWRGVFNPSNVAGYSAEYNKVSTFQDAGTEYLNGYLEGEDWETFNNKADVVLLSGATSSTTPRKLSVDVGSLNTANNQAYIGEMLLVAKEDDTAGTPGGIKSWKVYFTARNDADGNCEVLLPLQITVINASSISDESGWDLSSISVNEAAAGDPIEVFVVGGAATVSWSASINLTTVVELTP